MRTRAEELRRRDQDLERRDRIIAALTERIPQALEPPSEPRESPQTVEQEPEGAQPQPSTGEHPAATVGLSEAEPSLLWERVAVVILSILPFIADRVLVQLLDILWPRSGYVLAASAALAWVVFPAVFGFRLGRKRRSLRFWRNVAPVAALLALISYYPAVVIVGGRSTVFLAVVPSIAYIFAAVLGNALRRQTRERLIEERPSDFPQESATAAQGWTPRQQAIVGLAGTIISALIGLIGTILTVLDKT